MGFFSRNDERALSGPQNYSDLSPRIFLTPILSISRTPAHPYFQYFEEYSVRGRSLKLTPISAILVTVKWTIEWPHRVSYIPGCYQNSNIVVHLPGIYIIYILTNGFLFFYSHPCKLYRPQVYPNCVVLLFQMLIQMFKNSAGVSSFVPSRYHAGCISHETDFI